MKTVKDLRKFLLDQEDGKLVIGALEFRYSDGNDIDVYHEDDLIVWISSSADDETLLTEKFNSSSRINELRDKVSSAEEKNKTLESENTVLFDKNIQLSERVRSAEVAVGKVEAYEKLLLGRQVTIGK